MQLYLKCIWSMSENMLPWLQWEGKGWKSLGIAGSKQLVWASVKDSKYSKIHVFFPGVETTWTRELDGSGLNSNSTITSRVTSCKWLHLCFNFLICKTQVEIYSSLECTGSTKAMYVKCMQRTAWNAGGLLQSSVHFPSLPSLSSYPVSA